MNDGKINTKEVLNKIPLKDGDVDVVIHGNPEWHKTWGTIEDPDRYFLNYYYNGIFYKEAWEQNIIKRNKAPWQLEYTIITKSKENQNMWWTGRSSWYVGVTIILNNFYDIQKEYQRNVMETALDFLIKKWYISYDKNSNIPYQWQITDDSKLMKNIAIDLKKWIINSLNQNPYVYFKRKGS